MCTSLRRRNHSILVPLACLLLVATALALIGIAQSLADTSFERTPSSEVALQGTNRFYDAVNTVVRTGDVGALNAIVSSDFVDHVSNFGLASGREGLIQLLLARHETMPRSSLVIDQALAVGNEVAVRVHVESDSAGVFLGLPLPSTAQEWGLQETLRIENGAVVERWGSASRSLQAQPLWQLLCPTPDAQTSRRVLYLKHVLLVPDAHQLLSDETATQLVFVGSGQLTSVGEPRTHLGNGQPIPLPIKRSGPAASPAVNERAYSQFGDPVILAPGDFVEIPPSGRLTLANEGAREAHLIIVVITADPLAAAMSSEIRPTVEEIIPPGATLSAGRLVLAPGATFALESVAAPVLAIVEAGELDVEISREEGHLSRWQTLHVGRGTAGGIGDNVNWRAGPEESAVIFVVTIETTGVYSPEGPRR